jgi:hypothetical protein
MRARRTAFPRTPAPAERTAVLAAESIWAGVRPWQADGSAVTVTWSLMAATPNCTQDATEARGGSG